MIPFVASSHTAVVTVPSPSLKLTAMKCLVLTQIRGVCSSILKVVQRSAMRSVQGETPVPLKQPQKTSLPAVDFHSLLVILITMATPNTQMDQVVSATMTLTVLHKLSLQPEKDSCLIPTIAALPTNTGMQATVLSRQ